MAETKSVRTFNRTEAAAYLSAKAGRKKGETQVHPITVWRAYHRGDLKGTRDMLAKGGPIRFRQDDLDAFYESKVK